MNGLPDGIDEGNFVGEKFHEVQDARDGKDEWVREDLKFLGEMNDAEALEKAESGDGRVDVEAGGEAGAEDKAESFERVHGRNVIRATFRIGSKFQSTTKKLRRVNR